MQMYPGFITDRLQESKAFYMQYLGFETVFENDWFVLLRQGADELAFMLPGLKEQHAIFRSAFVQGAWLALEVENVQAVYEKLEAAGAPILTEVRDESWGDRHFVLQDPNGMGVDIYQRLEIAAEEPDS